MKAVSNRLDPEHTLFLKPASHGAGWMVSYADMMTIILTFTILLLSISAIPQTRFDMLVEALTGRQVGNLREVKERIDEVVAREGLAGEVATEIDEHGLRIELSNALLFASGSAELSERADQVFEPIGSHLVNDLEEVYGLVIEGYTDDVPIHTERYLSNWELSTSRAIHVMRRLNASGLSPSRMSVHGFADTRAAVDVDVADPDVRERLSKAELHSARARNRRVVIRVDRLSREQLLRLAQRGVLGNGVTPSVPAGVNGRIPGISVAPLTGERVLPSVQSRKEESP